MQTRALFRRGGEKVYQRSVSVCETRERWRALNTGLLDAILITHTVEHKKMAEKSNRSSQNIMLVFIKFVERGLSMELLNDFQWQITKMPHLFMAIMLNHYFF